VKDRPPITLSRLLIGDNVKACSRQSLPDTVEQDLAQLDGAARMKDETDLRKHGIADLTGDPHPPVSSRPAGLDIPNVRCNPVRLLRSPPQVWGKAALFKGTN
jgi:hypothetical protein